MAARRRVRGPGRAAIRPIPAGSGTSGSAAGPAFSSLTGYQLNAGSPAINAGVTINGSGGVDFWGDAINGAPDIGAYESP